MPNGRTTRALAFPLLVALGIGSNALAQVSPSWNHSPFSVNGADFWVGSLIEFDDGRGPALYAGGAFRMVGGTDANLAARWDGGEWSALGAGSTNAVLAFAAFDDGGGLALYAGGNFFGGSGGIGKWDGSAWRPLGTGLKDTVSSLAVFDDGTGPALYAGGNFTTATGSPGNRIAKWDGLAWTAPGDFSGSGRISTAVHALTVFDDGSGPSLFAAGRFVTADGATVDNIARWDGSTWHRVGNGLNGTVRALTVWDDGTGPALFVGGEFTIAFPDTPVARVARWNGERFSAVADGFDGRVNAFAVHDDGSGPTLFAGGDFGRSGDRIVAKAARLDGARWNALGSDVLDGEVTTFAPFDAGDGRRLIAGGWFRSAGATPLPFLGAWDGVAWKGLRDGGLGPEPRALASFVDREGAALYAGGSFTLAGGGAVNHVAKWKRERWTSVGTGVSGAVNALRVFDDGGGGGDALYAGGEFDRAGAIAANHVARWNGREWTALGSGVSGIVRALGVFDDGLGPALYAGGAFDSAGGAPASNVAKWDGVAWSPLAEGVDGDVSAFATFDDGSGPRLVVGGSFATAGGVTANGIATWNGLSWSPLGAGLGPTVRAIASFDDGSGPVLYAGGSFGTSGGPVPAHFARWDGVSWLPVGTGLPGAVLALEPAQDVGDGASLYVGGAFVKSGRYTFARIARWDGKTYRFVGGFDATVRALARHPSEAGVGLFAAGDFLAAEGRSSLRVARRIDVSNHCLAGTVNSRVGPIVDVLFVNDTAGGPGRRVELATYEPLRIFMSDTPATPGFAPFALYLWRGGSESPDPRDLPFGIGQTCLPTPLSGESPRLRATWNNTGRSGLGTPTSPSSAAPIEVVNRPRGTGRPVSFVLQGIIADPGSAGARRASVTNAVTVVVR